MPQNHIHYLRDLFDALPGPVKAAMLGAVVALLRILYDGREPRWIRRLLEAALCGFIALGVAHLTEALGLPPGWATFCGGAVGLFGADQVREWGRALATRKLKGEEK